MPHVYRALISVSDKRGLIEFAAALQDLHVTIISTGGTYSALKSHGIEAIPVSDVTHFPEILDGRVKTLHPNVHGALLAVPENEKHLQELKAHDIEAIDMVVVNLYPFEQTVARNGVPLEEALEQIDIGGPAMLRAAAKNFRHKVAIVNPDRYGIVLDEMKAQDGEVSEATCFMLAQEVFRHTSSYDAVIANYLDRAGRGNEGLPPLLHISLQKEQDLRYGENPHQRASLYGHFGSLFRKLHGKELSYNNIVDISAAALLVFEFDSPTVAIIKHTNPCGVGSAATIAEAYAKALATDPQSAFGGIVAVNRPLDRAAAETMNQMFTEVILAPDFDGPALDLLVRKKDRRLMQMTADFRSLSELQVKSVPGGLLAQEPDRGTVTLQNLKVVTRRQPTEEEVAAMMFAWRVAKHVKSNAIVYARKDRTIGIGAGQMSRVDSAKLSALKAKEAGLDLNGTAVASDAYFPFADGLIETARAGATAVIQPGGSVRDDEVIRAADEHNIAMALTGVRHFMH